MRIDDGCRPGTRSGRTKGPISTAATTGPVTLPAAWPGPCCVRAVLVEAKGAAVEVQQHAHTIALLEAACLVVICRSRGHCGRGSAVGCFQVRVLYAGGGGALKPPV
jgi:hypothetical protein